MNIDAVMKMNSSDRMAELATRALAIELFNVGRLAASESSCTPLYFLKGWSETLPEIQERYIAIAAYVLKDFTRKKK
jgi:hypothetical protein